jgi:hypothetical protein
MLKKAASFVLGRPSPCDVPKNVRLSRRTPCGRAEQPFKTSLTDTEENQTGRLPVYERKLFGSRCSTSAWRSSWATFLTLSRRIRLNRWTSTVRTLIPK